MESDLSGPGHTTKFFFGGYTYSSSDPVTATISLDGHTFNFATTDPTAVGSVFLSNIYDESPNVLTLGASVGNNDRFGTDLNTLNTQADLTNGVVSDYSGQLSLSTATGLELQVDLTPTSASTTYPISPAPEPGVWELAILGSGVAGYVLRKRSRQVPSKVRCIVA